MTLTTARLFAPVPLDRTDRLDTRTVVSDLNHASIEPVAAEGWRISDLLLDPSDPRHLLGFIEARGDGYEAMSIGTEFAWTTFDTITEALHHLLTEGRIQAIARSSGDMSWLAALPKSSVA